MRPAMYAASSFTNPMSADPRVCCHGRPRKNRPEASVTPRLWTIGAVRVLDRRGCRSTRSRIDTRSPRRSRRRPVRFRRRIQARRPTRFVSRFARVTPERRSLLGLDPMSTSRFANFRPSRESVLTFMNPIPDSHQKRSLPSRRCGKRGNALTDGEVDLPRRGEFLGDLEAGVASSHDEHSTVGQLTRVSIVRAVDLRRPCRPDPRRREERREPGTARSQRRPGPP